MKFKKIILDPNLLWKREAERFIDLLFPNFVGFEIDIEQHEVGLADDDWVTIRNSGTEKSYNISFNVNNEKEGVRIDFDYLPGYKTSQFLDGATGAELDELGYGTKLQIQNFALSRLDDPIIVLQFNQFLKDGTVPNLE